MSNWRNFVAVTPLLPIPAYSLDYSLWESIFREDLFLYNCLQTNWYSPGKEVSIESISANMSAVWVKIISSWLCFVIYMWTLVAPLILPDRDFSV